MALFQRTKTPLAEMEFEGQVPLPAGPRSAGDALRQQREALGLNFSDVAGTLRIKPAYLAAIEEGRPDRLPGPAYAAGFVRAYGDHLGLDGTEILRRFRLEAAGLDAKPDLSFPMPLGERSVPGRAMLLLALILAICGYGAWYYLSTDELARPERVTEVPATLLPPKPPKPAASATPAPIAPATSTTTTVQAAGGAPPSEPVSGTEMPAASEAEAAPGGSPPPAACDYPRHSSDASRPRSGHHFRSCLRAAHSEHQRRCGGGVCGRGGERDAADLQCGRWIDENCFEGQHRQLDSGTRFRPLGAIHRCAEARRELSGARPGWLVHEGRQCRRARRHGRWQTGAVSGSNWRGAQCGTRSPVADGGEHDLQLRPPGYRPSFCALPKPTTSQFARSPERGR